MSEKNSAQSDRKILFQKVRSLVEGSKYIKEDLDLFYQIISDKKSLTRDKIKFSLCLLLLSKYPSLLIDLNGIMFISKPYCSKSTLKRWLSEKDDVVIKKKIRYKIVSSDGAYQSNMKQPQIIAIDGVREAYFYLREGNYNDTRGRPLYGYRMINLEESMKKSNTNTSYVIDKMQDRTDSLLTLIFYDPSIIFRSELTEPLQTCVSDLMEIKGRLSWLMRECGLGFRSYDHSEKKIPVDIFMQGYKEIVKKIEESSIERKYEEIIEDYSVSISPIELGLIKLTILQKYDEENAFFICPKCCYQNILSLKKTPRKKIKCKLCFFELSFIQEVEIEL